MCNKSNLGDECYVCNISNYTDRILEISTYLTGGISLPKVFPALQRLMSLSNQSKRIICSNKEQQGKKWASDFIKNLAKTNEQLIFRFAKIERT